MDVHKKSWTVHFKTDLFDNKTVTMPAEPASLIKYVEKNFEGHEISCCYEAGCCGYWIARALKEKDWQVSVVNPADVPRNNKQDWQKTDKIDSRNLCKHLSDGNLKGIYIPDEQQEQLRSLFRRRIHLARHLRSIKNHIKSQLLYYGIKLPQKYDSPNWSREQLFRTLIIPMKGCFNFLNFNCIECIVNNLFYSFFHYSSSLKICQKFITDFTLAIFF